MCVLGDCLIQYSDNAQCTTLILPSIHFEMVNGEMFKDPFQTLYLITFHFQCP